MIQALFKVPVEGKEEWEPLEPEEAPEAKEVKKEEAKDEVKNE